MTALPLVVVFFFFDVVILHISRTNLRWPKPYETLAFLCGNTVLDIRFLLFLQQVDILYLQIFFGLLRAQFVKGVFAPNEAKSPFRILPGIIKRNQSFVKQHILANLNIIRDIDAQGYVLLQTFLLHLNPLQRFIVGAVTATALLVSTL